MELLSAGFNFINNQDLLTIDDSFFKNSGPYFTDMNYLQQEKGLGKKYLTNQVSSYKQKIPILKKTPTRQTPIASLEDFPGDFNFQYTLNASGVFKSNYAYSKKLSRVYLNLGQTLPMRFSWSAQHSDFWLRATMVFRDVHDRSLPVQRCYAHKAIELPENQGIGAEQLRHVFRVVEHEHQRRPVLYEDNGAGVLSVLVALGAPALGDKDVPVDFQFHCKNSCPTGINRRPTKMVFTLENEDGFVFGRRSLQVQICSCPKRDKDKDERGLEKSQSGKRPVKKPMPFKSPPPPIPPRSPSDNSCGSPTNDQNVYPLSLEVVGEENYKAVLKYAYDVMAANAIRSGNYETYQPHMDEILMKLQQ